ncbi:MAG: LssY C-terminal domain-containing protein [Mobilicoccus sp.]|nr:LssY C-terminal domain-containing protein [Mobilicoccus sp.]
MPRQPVYDHPPEKVQDWRVRRLFSLALVENLFFGVATVFSLLFAALLLRAGFGRWIDLLYLIVFWAVLAYLALPRVHRVLTALYVPDYFIGRARTTDGLLGDPVNLAFVGDEQRIHEAMRRAGWVEADPVNLTTSWRIVSSSLRRRSYPQAPVSPLMLFGTIQSFAYQQEVDGNPAQRHHVRFWPCPPGWLLPGGHRVDWLASGTYDRAVGLSWFTLQVTHRIDRDIDVERDYIVDSLRYASPEIRVSTIEDFSTGYHHRNGGGDAITTDGDLPVVDVHPVSVPEAARDEGEQSGDKDDLLHDVGRRPFSVVAAGALTLLSLLVSFGGAAREVMLVNAAELGEPTEGLILRGILIGVILLLSALSALLAWFTYEGRQWARLTMMVLLTANLVTHFAVVAGGDRPAATTLATITVDLLTIYALTSLSARAWTQSQGRRRRRPRPGT